MILNFKEMELKVIPNFNGGEKEFRANIYQDEHNKIVNGRLIPGASIGWHCHDTSSETIFILSGKGKLNGEEVKKGDHLLLTANFGELTVEGDLEFIYSHI